MSLHSVENPTLAERLKLSRLTLFAVVIVILGSGVLGAAQINQQGYWNDEMTSIGYITDFTTWSRIAPEQMPTYYLILRGWTDVVGLSEVAGRALSLFFGLLTLALMYRLVRENLSPSIAFITLLLLGSSAFFVRYYREMRTYTLLVLGCTASMYFFLKWLRNQQARDAAAYVIFSIIAVYSHYFAGLVIAVEGIYFLLAVQPFSWRPRPHFLFNRFIGVTLGLFACIALAIIPYLTIYLSVLDILISGRYTVYTLTPSQALQSTVSALTNDSLAAFAILIVLAIVARRKASTLVFLWVFIPLGAVLLVHTFIYRMLVSPRYLLFIWPPFAAAAAIGLLALPRQAMRISLGVLVCVGVAQVYNDLPRTMPGTLNNPPWREMFSMIGPDIRNDGLVFVNMVDLVGLSGYRLPMLYYFNRFMPPNAPKPFELEFPPEPNASQLDNAARGTQEVWFISTDGESNQRGDVARTVLSRDYFAQCGNWNYPKYATYLVRWDKVDGDMLQFTNGLRIQRSPLNTVKDTYRVGETLNLAFGLYTTTALSVDYSMGVYLFNRLGQVVAEQDYAPARTRTSTWTINDRYCDVRALTLPTEPGDYAVKLALYDSNSGTRVSASTPDSAEDNLITFLNVTIK